MTTSASKNIGTHYRTTEIDFFENTSVTVQIKRYRVQGNQGNNHQYYVLGIDGSEVTPVLLDPHGRSESKNSEFLSKLPGVFESSEVKRGNIFNLQYEEVSYKLNVLEALRFFSWNPPVDSINPADLFDL